MTVTHPTGLVELHAMADRVRTLWLPPPDISIEEWARAKRVLPSQSGRPGEWKADPIQREIEEACCDPSVNEVVFMKATRLGWSEVCNNVLGWGVDVHAMAMLMAQPTREAGEDYAKERLEEMIDSTPSLKAILRAASKNESGSTVRNKRFTNGASISVVSAGNAREMRSKRSRFVIQDEADGYKNDVSDEGDPDKILRRRLDEFGAAGRLLIGSTPGMPQGISRIEKAYNRSSQGIHLNPCPHCNAMEPFLWRHPENPSLYLLKYEKTSDNQVIPESVHWTCIRCGAAIEERWKFSMMEAGHWLHRRPAVTAVRGFWANGLYAVFPGHWAKMAQEWVDAQGDQLELKAFINLHLAETFTEKGESVEPSFLRKKAEQEDRPRAVVPDGVALLLVQVDIQTAGLGRFEAQVVGFAPDERAYLVDFQVFPGDPQQDHSYEDLEAWLLDGWPHANGGRMHPHLVLLDARDGNCKDAIYRYCAPRADRWVFPQMGVDTLASKGWAEESGARKMAQRMFLSATDDCKRVVMSRLNLDPNAPKSIHLPAWVSDEYLAQLGGEKRVSTTDVKTRKTTYKWVKTRNRNEAVDLWGYAYSGWWIVTHILAPELSGPNGREILENLARQASQAKDDVVYTQGSGRRIRSKGIY